jgi:tripartite-type tricarboxylate transporter receptor subunit TctC
VLERLRTASVKTLQSAEIKQQFATQSSLPSPTTPAEFTAFVKSEQAKWGPVVLATGVKLE